ncbi:N-acetylmuramoyl-L-alanine amidase, putative [Oceanicola granulosus HTCC2516]|uniref:N-acetylmuramoyl-L-alanine amidase n=1 Tax=Oceanicola granulosus (strain ATCC BAA-861 / DSM 15982 / KCTC 12143 / HTCC2516) TaxID=314256 RepID=Q2CFB1_OCEGH|nr:N-acetylmuramoyl-L-alanine amidase [Oceanicola granulosus]EAR51384.1 N-acetylmuramoyl-L-alanine amidase, putative [Oceanicola granulosus HTCC2516]
MRHAGALWQPSPNFGARRGGAVPDLVVLHYTAMESCAAALERLCAAEHEVSAHYLIAADGTLVQLVDETDRAWHAGAGAWGAVDDVNSRSIGIELDNRGDDPFPEPQLARLEALLADLLARHRIPPERVIGHSDMAPGRKHDPGPRFPWRRLARAGLSVWPDADPGPDRAAAPDRVRLAAALAAFGYRGELAPMLDAFHLRFRPHAGAPDATDLAMAEALAARWPVRPA